MEGSECQLEGQEAVWEGKETAKGVPRSPAKQKQALDQEWGMLYGAENCHWRKNSKTPSGAVWEPKRWDGNETLTPVQKRQGHRDTLAPSLLMTEMSKGGTPEDIRGGGWCSSVSDEEEDFKMTPVFSWRRRGPSRRVVTTGPRGALDIKRRSYRGPPL